MTFDVVNYYKILGVPEDASTLDIKEAFDAYENKQRTRFEPR